MRAITFEGTLETCGGGPLRRQCLRKPDISPYRQIACFQASSMNAIRIPRP